MVRIRQEGHDMIPGDLAFDTSPYSRCGLMTTEGDRHAKP